MCIIFTSTADLQPKLGENFGQLTVDETGSTTSFFVLNGPGTEETHYLHWFLALFFLLVGFSTLLWAQFILSSILEGVIIFHHRNPAEQ